ncbi:hypothetical protein RM704_45115, partial [Streptomyces sp. DSM 3412]|nr:hypothetical protein [Streptomyces sp. DSM 3412]
GADLSERVHDARRAGVTVLSSTSGDRELVAPAHEALAASAASGADLSERVHDARRAGVTVLSSTSGDRELVAPAHEALAASAAS